MTSYPTKPPIESVLLVEGLVCDIVINISLVRTLAFFYAKKP